MALNHRIAGRTAALIRESPALGAPAKRTAVRHLARMLLQADDLTEQLLDGKLSGQPSLRAIADLNRAIIDLMARLGLVPGLPKAGEEADVDAEDEDLPPEVRRMIGGTR